MASPPNFASKELAQILAEQGSAIRGYAIKEKSDTELEASAEVQLLEGTSVVIALTARGYQVCYKSYLLCLSYTMYCTDCGA